MKQILSPIACATILVVSSETQTPSLKRNQGKVSIRKYWQPKDYRCECVRVVKNPSRIAIQQANMDQPRRFGIASALSLAMLMEALDFFFSSFAAPAAPAFGFTPKVGILEAIF